MTKQKVLIVQANGSEDLNGKVNKALQPDLADKWKIVSVQTSCSGYSDLDNPIVHFVTTILLEKDT